MNWLLGFVSCHVLLDFRIYSEREVIDEETSRIANL